MKGRILLQSTGCCSTVRRSACYAAVVVCAGVFAACGFALPARADVFELQNGGEVRGKWLNGESRPTKVYEVELENGGKISLPASQVKNVVRQRPLEIEYEARAATTPDTVEDQWQLAEWCRLNALSTQRQWHLRHIVELDPDHAVARAALGFNRVNGKWTTPAEWREENGYTLYQGKWRSAQEIELLEEHRRQDLAEKEWTVRLRRWRDGLATAKAQEFTEKIAAVRAPEAVPGLTELLVRDRTREGKKLYLDTLAKIDSQGALTVLVKTSLDDPDEEVFYMCVDHLLQSKYPKLANAYIMVLKGSNNVQVNRSAYVLGRLGDRSAIEPLIEALTTTHKITIMPTGSASPDAISTTFSNDGTAGVTAGNRVRTEYRTVPNPNVLSALSRLGEGANFAYDKAAWRRWFASQKKPAGNDPAPLRRD